MSDSVEQVKKRMKELELLILETKKRLPAHSVKPPVMADLLEYEDEYYFLMNIYNKGELMMKVTEKAQEQIAEYFKDKEATPVRIYLNSGG